MTVRLKADTTGWRELYQRHAPRQWVFVAKGPIGVASWTPTASIGREVVTAESRTEQTSEHFKIRSVSDGCAWGWGPTRI